MFITFGTPMKLADLGLTCPELRELKQKTQIAIIDDQPFLRANALRNHGFNIVEMGGEITSIDQVLAYPIVVCDIKGVGKAFGSRFEGAHVLAEIRKSFPDKFLISYSGSEYDVSYNENLGKADKSATKDAQTEYWVALLETGLKAVGDPKERWIRFRKTLLEKGVDLYEVFKLEQAFIKSLNAKDQSIMAKAAVPDEIKELVKAFASVALAQIIEMVGK